MDGVRALRLRLLLRLEVERLCRDLPARREFLVTVWSRFRARDGFEATLFSRWRAVSPSDLAEMDEEALELLHAFYDRWDELWLYLRFTEDMPETLGEQYDLAVVALSELGGKVVERLR